jgi:hypothetical protein
VARQSGADARGRFFVAAIARTDNLHRDHRKRRQDLLERNVGGDACDAISDREDVREPERLFRRTAFAPTRPTLASFRRSGGRRERPRNDAAVGCVGPPRHRGSAGCRNNASQGFSHPGSNCRRKGTASRRIAPLGDRGAKPGRSARGSHGRRPPTAHCMVRELSNRRLSRGTCRVPLARKDVLQVACRPAILRAAVAPSRHALAEFGPGSAGGCRSLWHPSGGGDLSGSPSGAGHGADAASRPPMRGGADSRRVRRSA